MPGEGDQTDGDETVHGGGERGAQGGGTETLERL